MKPDFKDAAYEYKKYMELRRDPVMLISTEIDFVAGADHGYSVAMEQKRDILNEVLEYDYQHLLKHRVSAISADLSDKIRKHLSSFTEREQPKD